MYLVIFLPSVPGAPVQLSCTQNEETVNLELTWEAATSICNISKYIVHYNATILWVDYTEFTNFTVVENAETRYVLENPSPYTNYLFQVQSVAAGDVKGDQAVCNITSDEAGKVLMSLVHVVWA